MPTGDDTAAVTLLIILQDRQTHPTGRYVFRRAAVIDVRAVHANPQDGRR